jgi:hypothetical protein
MPDSPRERAAGLSGADGFRSAPKWRNCEVYEPHVSRAKRKSTSPRPSDKHAYIVVRPRGISNAWRRTLSLFSFRV